MIYLAKHKILFLKPRKVAGTSFEMALSNFSNHADDIITPISKKDEKQRSVRPKNYNKQDFLYYNHISQDELSSQLMESKKIKKISVIRHPIDMAISFYFWETKNDKNPVDFFNWLQHNYNEVLTQNRQFYFYNGKYSIDCMIKYEQIISDIKECENKYISIKGLSNHFQHYNAKTGIRKRNSIQLTDDQRLELKKMFDLTCEWEKNKFGYLYYDIDTFL